MIHLTPARLAALLEGTLAPAEAAALAAHLGEDCAVCDAAVEHGPDLETLARLLEAGAGTSEPLGGAARERIWHGVAASTRRPWWRGPAVVGALLLAAAALLFLLPDRGGDERTAKGECPEVAPEVTLRVVAGRMGAEGLDLERRVASGETLNPELTLIFEVEADREAARYLFAVHGGEAFQLEPPPGEGAGVVSAGRVRVPTGFALDDVRGELSLVAGAALEPIEAGEILDAWRAGVDPCGVATQVETVEVAR